MKKLTVLLIGASLLFSLCACGASKSENSRKESSAPAATESPMGEVSVTPEITGVGNPVEEATPLSLHDEFGYDFSALSTCENAVFSRINGSPAIAQVSYAHYGDDFCFRLARTDEKMDISGMNYTWHIRTSNQIGSFKAFVGLNNDGAGLIYWYDSTAKLMYSLSMNANATEDTLVAEALELCPETAAASTITVTVDPAFVDAYLLLLDDFHTDYHPGTAGSTLTGLAYAARFADLYTEYRPSVEAVSELVLLFYSATVTTVEEIEALNEQIGGMIDLYEYLIDGGMGTLDSAGYTPTHTPWNTEFLAPLFAAMKQ